MLYYPNLSFIFLQHSETFDVSHDFLPPTIAALSTLKQVRFFLAHPVFCWSITVIMLCCTKWTFKCRSMPCCDRGPPQAMLIMPTDPPLAFIQNNVFDSSVMVLKGRWGAENYNFWTDAANFGRLSSDSFIFPTEDYYGCSELNNVLKFSLIAAY